MKLKKSFSFTNKNQIWRLLISNSNYLLIETRDIDAKEVFFNCIDLEKGKRIIKNLQFEDKFWIGIEKIYDNFIVFHKFAKPDMPEHQGVIVFDILLNKIVWENDEITFLALEGNKIYGAVKKFAIQNFNIYNLENGKVIEELGSDRSKVSPLLEKDEDFSNYKYPERLTGYEDEEIISIIKKEISHEDELNYLDYLKVENLLIFNFYQKQINNSFDNVFLVYDIVKGKRVLSDKLNKNLNAVSPDTFFCYKDWLILLKNKSELVTYKIV